MLFSQKCLHLLQEINGRWEIRDSSSFWRKFWKLKIPPKVKNFMWRALTQCLPTTHNLKLKFVPVEDVCPLCRGAPETMFHYLVECQFAKQCLSKVIKDF